MASKSPTIEVYEGGNGQWYWRVKAKNGEIALDGTEPFATRGNARRAARRAKQLMTDAVFV